MKSVEITQGLSDTEIKNANDHGLRPIAISYEEANDLFYHGASVVVCMSIVPRNYRVCVSAAEAREFYSR